ncbi:hypothetical protein [Lolliginicoccus suaedae]|uniref:hypothetical protein n=1 Tax=Lolliginicoccus suaedae TaxID=2605429 RepID=UPI0011EBED89|nr:hypothetical protein [Lolliginicoccus suaedae]
MARVPRPSVRSAAIPAAAVIAFWPTWTGMFVATQSGGDTGYYPIFVILVLLAAVGIARRPRQRLPISDRQANAIAGFLGLVVAGLIKLLVVPRYAEHHVLLQLDLLAALILLLSATVLLFGLRQLGTYWPLWLALIAGGPLSYRLLSSLLGGDARANGTASILICASAIALGLGRHRREYLAIYALACAIGFVALSLLITLAPGFGLVQFQRLPVVIAAAATWLLIRWQCRHAGPRPLERTPQSVPGSTESSWRSVAVLAIAAGLIATIPVPETSRAEVAEGPGSPPRITQVVPAGWVEDSREEYTWVRRYFGPEATLGRQVLRATPGNSELELLDPGPAGTGAVTALLDPQLPSTPPPARRVAIDTFTLPNRVQLDIYPVGTLYDLSGTRRSTPQRVDLGEGVSGHLQSVIDEEQYLTTTRLDLAWQRGDVVQRIVLTTLDNREAGARFPEPEPSMASNLAVLLEIFFRGNAALTDLQPQIKDAQLMTTIARQLVAAQFAGY